MSAARMKLAATLAVRNPVLLADYGRWFFEGRKLKPAQSRQAQPDAIPLDVARDLLVRRYADWSDGPALSELRSHRFDDSAKMGGSAYMAGDSALGMLAYWTVRAVRPRTIVETGVATGVTSAHILAAIRDNGHGKLRSIDLPPVDMIVRDAVGAAIPKPWKKDWDYHWGSAKRLLPKLLVSDPPIVFLHDSDHSYAHMSWELNTAWRALHPGDLILCDDADFHAAFRDVAASHQATPTLVGQAEKNGATGVLFR